MQIIRKLLRRDQIQRFVFRIRIIDLFVDQVLLSGLFFVFRLDLVFGLARQITDGRLVVFLQDLRFFLFGHTFRDLFFFYGPLSFNVALSVLRRIPKGLLVSGFFFL